jgi:hypothetical protein
MPAGQLTRYLASMIITVSGLPTFKSDGV